jgi:hypothetical protein
MKRIILSAVLSIGLAGACFAQTSGTSDRQGGMGMKAMDPNHPHGPSITDSGQVRPCNQRMSGTSDRQGGQGMASTESGGPQSNVGGSVSGGC